jgi:dipeptide/tripeptide permease
VAGSGSTAIRAASLAVTVAAIGLPIAAMALGRRDPMMKELRVVFTIAIFAVGAANYGNTFTTSLGAGMVRAGSGALSVTILDLFYGLNQMAEIVAACIGLGFVFRGRSSAP